jgi:hypothetical protein
MKNKSIAILTCIIVAIIIISALYINSLRGYLSDCRFECNSLQTKLNQCEELSDYAIILRQILPPKAWGQLRAANEAEKQRRHWAYEGREMSLLTEKEKKICLD